MALKRDKQAHRSDVNQGCFSVLVASVELDTWEVFVCVCVL